LGFRLFVDRFSDEFSAFPLRAVSFAHAFGDAAVALGGSHPALPRLATVVTLAYGAVASVIRNRRAAAPHRDAELARKDGVRAGVDSALTLWLECVTLPGIGLGLAARAAARAGGGARARGAALLLATPPVLAASSHGADALMQWSLRPAIAHFAQPRARADARDARDYLPPPPEDVLAALDGGGAGGAAGAHDALFSLLPADFDALDRERLRWALDGDAHSPYPMPPHAGAAASE
jgi:hypothetical protein